jgi:NTP pyrophosphatase (non-canonical NTP hydrolase)
MKMLQKEVREYLLERGWEKLPLEDVAKSISIEAAELLEHFQWSQFHKAKKLNLLEVQEELADIVTYCLDMAVAMDVDLETIVRNKLEKVRRKYPPDVICEDESNYYKLKQNNRKK